MKHPLSKWCCWNDVYLVLQSRQISGSRSEVTISCGYTWNISYEVNVSQSCFKVVSLFAASPSGRNLAFTQMIMTAILEIRSWRLAWLPRTCSTCCQPDINNHTNDDIRTLTLFSTTFSMSAVAFSGGKRVPIVDTTLTAWIELSMNVSAPTRKTGDWDSLRLLSVDGAAFLMIQIFVVNFQGDIEKQSECVCEHLPVMPMAF